MKQYEVLAEHESETFTIAESLSRYLQPSDVIALEGDLGAGKTTFTKGIAKGLGIKRNVNSPTFTIIKEYQGSMPLYHMDVYRLENSMEDLGFDEYFHGEGITIVEWAHLIDDQLPDNYLIIEIYLQGDLSRKFVFKPKGERYEQLCKEFFNEYISN